MELNVNGDGVDGLISNRQIEQSIRSLTGDGDSFAILARSEQVYIQTSGDPKNGFVLEYRNGSEEEHYSCSNVDLNAEQIIRAFQSYSAGDDRWKAEFEWKPHLFNYSGEPKSGGKLAAIIGVFIAVAVAWKVFFAT